MAIKLGPINLVISKDKKQAATNKPAQPKPQPINPKTMTPPVKSANPIKPKPEPMNKKQLLGLVLLIAGVILIGVAILTW